MGAYARPCAGPRVLGGDARVVDRRFYNIVMVAGYEIGGGIDGRRVGEYEGRCEGGYEGVHVRV